MKGTEKSQGLYKPLTPGQEAMRSGRKFTFLEYLDQGKCVCSVSLNFLIRCAILNPFYR